MLSHELVSAIQRDREREVRRALSVRRQLDQPRAGHRPHPTPPPSARPVGPAPHPVR
jgi:hypothetical protein